MTSTPATPKPPKPRKDQLQKSIKNACLDDHDILGICFGKHDEFDKCERSIYALSAISIAFYVAVVMASFENHCQLAGVLRTRGHLPIKANCSDALVDNKNWTDSWGHTCGNYTFCDGTPGRCNSFDAEGNYNEGVDDINWCNTYGQYKYRLDDTDITHAGFCSANQACCACGGGNVLLQKGGSDHKKWTNKQMNETCEASAFLGWDTDGLPTMTLASGEVIYIEACTEYGPIMRWLWESLVAGFVQIFLLGSCAKYVLKKKQDGEKGCGKNMNRCVYAIIVVQILAAVACIAWYNEEAKKLEENGGDPPSFQEITMRIVWTVLGSIGLFGPLSRAALLYCCGCEIDDENEVVSLDALGDELSGF